MSSPVVRALPSRPDLEYERKQAKRLLRDARRGDSGALARLRAQNRSLVSTPVAGLKLADAQLAIAREYGFRSWSLLVRYFETFARHEKSEIYRNDLADGPKEWWVKTILAEHRDGRHWTAILLGTFVPRFYGASLEEILAASVTTEDAQLLVARERGFARWDDMLAWQATMERPDPWVRRSDALSQLSRAVARADLAEMERVHAEHPGVLAAPGNHPRLARAALEFRIPGREISPAVVEWLRAHGVNVQQTLDLQLRGFFGGRMPTHIVRTLLELGADPSAIAPNGLPVLEHALYRYWNGEAVDLLLARAEPRDTFWVAAGVGDTQRLRRYFDRSGKLTAAARRNRPDLMALSGHADAMLPDPGDKTILWEAAFVAAVNGRAGTLDVLLANGFDIDAHWGMTLLSFAVGNGLRQMVELLVSRGANPDVRGWRPAHTPREMCLGYLANRMDDPDARRIVELLGWTPDALAREADARRGPPQRYPALKQALALASRDALRRGETRIGPESFLAGIVSAPLSHNEIVALGHGGVDLSRLKEQYQLHGPETSTDTSELPLDDGLQRALDAATRRAAERREGISPGAVLYFSLELQPVAAIIRELGGEVQQVKDFMKRLVP